MGQPSRNVQNVTGIICWRGALCVLLKNLIPKYVVHRNCSRVQRPLVERLRYGARLYVT